MIILRLFILAVEYTRHFNRVEIESIVMNDDDVMVARTQDGRCLLWEEPDNPHKSCKLLGTEIYHLHDALTRAGRPQTGGAVIVDMPSGIEA